MFNVANSQELIQTIQLWGYPAMFLLMILEGPLATLSSAFLASLGYFNPLIVFFLSLIGDIIGDIILYYIGYLGGHKIILKAEKLLKIKKSIISQIEKKFSKSEGKIIFSVKATVGLVYVTFILAGAIRMKIKKFLWFSFLGGLVWSSFLVATGYFFGYAAKQIEQYIQYAGIIVFILFVFVFILINLYKKKRSDQFFL